MIGRDALGRFVPGYSPDRGRGKPPARKPVLLDQDMCRIVMDAANLPVTIPRGRGRQIVTLFEANIRRLASGSIPRRAAVMDFVRLVFECADAPVIASTPTSPRWGEMSWLEDELDRLRAVASSGSATEIDRMAASFQETIIEVVGRRRAH